MLCHLGSAKKWCLMCELEQYASMLRECGGPLSPSRILSNMRNIGCRLGGGSQEDAHEFLRCHNAHAPLLLFFFFPEIFTYYPCKINYLHRKHPKSEFSYVSFSNVVYYICTLIENTSCKILFLVQNQRFL